MKKALFLGTFLFLFIGIFAFGKGNNVSTFTLGNPDKIMETFLAYNAIEDEDFNCNAQYQDVNGLVVMQAENLILPSGWAKQSSQTGFTGSGYINWTGSDFFSTPGNGLISTKIFINSPGTYRFQFRTKIGRGTNSTEHNDTWVRFPDASNFFAQNGSSILYPKGSGKTPNPEGAGSNGWFKVYMNSLSWSWDAFTSDFDGHFIYVTFNTSGTYTMQLSARSKDHLIDRIVLYKTTATNPLSLSQAETTCSGGGSTVAVTGITTTPSSASIQVGGTQQITANVSPSGATNKTVTWTSSNNNVATVSTSGLVTGVGVGSATITGRTQDGGFTDTTSITVTQGSTTVPVTGIVTTPSTASILLGNTVQINATVSPTNATNKTVTWTSSNNNVATVSTSGLVNGVGVGSATITGRTQDGGFTDTTSITVTQGSSSTNSVVSFSLINATTNAVISTLANGQQIPLSQIQNTSLNIRANTNPSSVGSVLLSISGPISSSITENVAPYALFGDTAGNYNGRTFTTGSYTVTATPYSGSNRSGTAGTPLTVQFSVVQSTATTGVTSLTLFNADNGSAIQNLSNGAVIPSSLVSGKKLTIVASTSGNVSSVRLRLTGPVSENRSEGSAPFTLFGDIDATGQFLGKLLPNGNYQIVATPNTGTAVSLSFSISNTASAVAQGLDLVAESKTIKAYPNPIRNGKVTISEPNLKKGNVSYTLYYMDGTKADSGNLNVKAQSFEVDFSQKMKYPGIYFLVLEGNTFSKPTRLTLVRE